MEPVEAFAQVVAEGRRLVLPQSQQALKRFVSGGYRPSAPIG